MIVGRHLRIIVVTIALALTLPVQRVAAVPPTAPANTAGSSCNIATSTDLTAISTSTNTATLWRLTCNWSPVNLSNSGAARHEQRPFTGGCGGVSPVACGPTDGASVTGTYEIGMVNYSGTPSSSDITLRHGAITSGVRCTPTTGGWSMTLDPSGTHATWQWRCSNYTSLTGFGNSNVMIEDMILVAGPLGAAVNPMGGAVGGGVCGILPASLTGYTTWRGSCNRVTWANINTADTQYTWQPPSPCEALRMYIPNPGRVIAPGGALSFEFLSGWAGLEATNEAVLSYRWAPDDAWKPLHDFTPVFGTDPGPEWTMPNYSGRSQTGVNFEVRCVDDTTTLYLRGDNSVGDADPQVSRACASLTIGWPEEGIYGGGDSIGLSFVLTDSAGADEIDELVVSAGRFGSEQTDTIDTVTDVDTIGFSDFDGTPTALPIGPGAYVTTFSFTNEWNTDDGLALRCHDGTGYRNFTFTAPSGVGKAPLPEGYDDRFDECLEGVNFGWRPSSWVPAFFRTTGCVAQVLFVPIDSDIAVLTDGASEAGEKAPISYVVAVGGELQGMLSGAPAAVDAGRNGCLTVLGQMDEIGLDDPTTACPSMLDGSTMTTARSIMGAGAWVLIALGFFGATKRMISK